MALTSGVMPSDIEAELGRPLTPSQVDQVTRWITDAEMLINVRLGAERMVELDADVYAFVVRQAVMRRLERSDSGSASSTTVSVDDASVTRRYDEGGDRHWWFLPEWWDLLDPSESGAFSTRPTFEPGAAGDSPNWWGYEAGNWQGPDIG